MKVDSGQGLGIVEGAKLLICLHLLVLCLSLPAAAQYRLVIRQSAADTVPLASLALTTSFPGRDSCLAYVERIPQLLARKGYAAASVDSLEADSTAATIGLYVGKRFGWGRLQVEGMTDRELQQTGLVMVRQRGQAFSESVVEGWQKALVGWLGERGYPFAAAELDSIRLDTADSGDLLVSAVMKVSKGIPYTLDSIRVEGAAKISGRFLHRYLDLPRGGPYNRNGFGDISARLRELPFLVESKPWALRFGGNGAVLDLFLEPRKSSQVNVLVGLLPGTDNVGKNKMQVTGEANLNLKNALGNGETIGVNWQQLQVKSPRLNLLYQQPYLLGSAFGISTQFDLFKKDSSFLNLNGQFGLQYSLSARQTGKVFMQLFRTNLVEVDTARIRSTRSLPQDLDLGLVNLGVDYELYTTNYRRNPRRGWELFSSIMAGTRKVRRNNAILDIKDPSFNYASLYDTVQLSSYQFRLKARVARYLPVGRQSAIQLLASGGWVESPVLYRNELFQLGGYKLMRGFDEESFFASRYLVNTVEYRYLVGMNSYFFGFADLGWIGNRSSMGRGKNRLWGLGLGLAFETTAGYFNLSLAAGKRDENSFNLRQTKIHLGYVNYF